MYFGIFYIAPFSISSTKIRLKNSSALAPSLSYLPFFFLLSSPSFISQLGRYLLRASNGSLLFPSSTCSGCCSALHWLLDLALGLLCCQIQALDAIGCMASASPDKQPLPCPCGLDTSTTHGLATGSWLLHVHYL